MKKIHFSNEKDGFYGTYYPRKQGSEAAVIGMFGDDANDLLARKAASWLHGCGLNVLCMSPAKKNYGHVNVPLETIGNAVAWLKKQGIAKIGIVGMSTTAMFALTAASYFPDLTLTIALTPSDFIWQGFEQGNKDGCKEWPVPGTSTLSYEGKPLPYMPFAYQHPDYWHVIQEETKGTHNFLCSRRIFDDSEKIRPHSEDEMIKVENIHGVIVLAAAEDDTLWDAAKYIRRMQERLENKKSVYTELDVLIYEHGTHFVIPESLVKSILPVGSELVLGMLMDAAKRYPKECKCTRLDLERSVRHAINRWRLL